MRFVERSEAAPEALVEKGAEERARAALYFDPAGPKGPKVSFAIYKHNEVKLALERLFHGKCAYCETFYASTQPMDVEHYRPKGAVIEDTDHTGYWWIAMEWTNLLPSCIDCNRKRNQPTPEGDTSLVRLHEQTAQFTRSVTIGSGKKDSFPLAATGIRSRSATDPLQAEKPLLLNPAEDDPQKHMEYFFDRENPVSFILPRALPDGEDDDFAGEGRLSQKGATSIHVYGLNRLRLVQARTEILRKLEFLAGLVIDLKSLADELGDDGDDDEMAVRTSRLISGFADNLIAEMRRMAEPSMPYSAMVRAWLGNFVDRLAQQD